MPILKNAGVDLAQHTLLVRVRRIVRHADQVFSIEIDKDIVVEGVFFKCARIYYPQAMERIDAQLFRSETNDRAVLLVQGVDGEHFRPCAALAVDPAAGQWGGEMGIGDRR